MPNHQAFIGDFRGLRLCTSLILSAQFLIFTGCQVSGSFQGLYAYRHEVDSCSWVVSPDDFDCELTYGPDAKVVVANGDQLLKCLQLQGDRQAILYLWRPNCSGRYCLDLNVLQGIADSAVLTLYVVAEYYDKQKMEENVNLRFPIIGIDTDYYDSKKTKTYVKLFFEQLGVDCPAYDKQSYFFFSGGDLQKASKTMVPQR